MTIAAHSTANRTAGIRSMHPMSRLAADAASMNCSITLTTMRAQTEGDRKLELGNIAVLDSVPDSVFTSPGPAAP